MSHTATTTYDPLAEQLAYYCARASEYDEWWLRLGRYDRGTEHTSQWFMEGAEVAAALDAFNPAGDVLELAGGTGIWSENLLIHADSLTVVDGSQEMLLLNAARLQSPKASHIQADLFDWQPTRRYDAVFFGFWLSHVPPERFDAFWQLVARCLKPGGRFFFLDSRREGTSTAKDHQLPAQESTTHLRRLNDGREFHVIKVFHQPDELAARLRQSGWQTEIHHTQNYFIYGSGTLSQPA